LNERKALYNASLVVIVAEVLKGRKSSANVIGAADGS
jgi:hypothetical protein